jgi:hypothetical protein
MAPPGNAQGWSGRSALATGPISAGPGHIASLQVSTAVAGWDPSAVDYIVGSGRFAVGSGRFAADWDPSAVDCIAGSGRFAVGHTVVGWGPVGSDPVVAGSDRRMGPYLGSDLTFCVFLDGHVSQDYVWCGCPAP